MAPKHLAFLCCFGLGLASSSPFVRIVQDDSGAWWFTRGGKRFLSMGINHVNNGGLDDGVGGRESSQCVKRTGNANCGDTLSFSRDGSGAPYFNATMQRYGTEQGWSEAAVSRLGQWGFNTVGGWSATIAEQEAVVQGLLYVRLLDMGTTWLNHDGLDFDVWSAEFEERCDAIALRECLPRANDTNLLGWQLDNELHWGSKTLSLHGYLSLSVGSPGRQRAEAFVQAFGHDSNAFLGEVADRYFSVTAAAIRKYDANHLNLGLRGANLGSSSAGKPVTIPTLAFKALPAVMLAQAKYVDVLDWHGYLDTPGGDYCGIPLSDKIFDGAMEALYVATQKPILVGEFSFTAKDSGMPNTIGARACAHPPLCLPGCPYTTQSQRGEAYTRYVSSLASTPFVVGWHWWQWVDEPHIGRWPDGEDSNYGLVNINDDPYPDLVSAMQKLNGEVMALHNASGSSVGPGIQWAV